MVVKHLLCMKSSVHRKPWCVFPVFIPGVSKAAWGVQGRRLTVAGGRGHGGNWATIVPKNHLPTTRGCAQMKIQIWRFRTCTAKKPWCSPVSHQLHLFSVGNPVILLPFTSGMRTDISGLGFWATGSWERHISLSCWFHSLSATRPLVWGAIFSAPTFSSIHRTVIWKNNWKNN